MKRLLKRALLMLLVATLLLGAATPAAMALVYGSLDRYNGSTLKVWEDGSAFVLKGKRFRLVMTQQQGGTSRSLKLASASSSRPSVASITQTGWVKALRAGTTRLTLRAEDGSLYSMELTVVNSNTPTGIYFSRKSLTVPRSEKTRLAAYLHARPIDGLLGKNRVTWTSGNARVASVNSLGVVTPRRTGDVTITARCGGRKASIVLKIR